MTDSPPPRPRGPLHPATRLGRIQQQLRTFAELHGSELNGVVAQIEEAGLDEISSRLKAYGDLHEQEIAMVIEELADLESDLAETQAAHEEAPSTARDSVDPAEHSPKRARWLAAQQNRPPTRPVSRRGFLFPGGGAE